MNKALLSAIAISTLFGSAFAQDVAKDQTPPAKPDQGAAQPLTTKTFNDYQIGISFDHPTTWVVVADPKVKKNWLDSLIGKKGKQKLGPGKQAEGESLFYIPATQNRTANLEIYPALWADAPDKWEENQTLINKNLNRTVVKQWREEILGVPLLLTKINYDDGTGPVVGLIGLVYSRTPYKMLFRLTANDTDFDGAEYEFRQVLQTLKTTNGALPVAEDPNHPLDQSAYTNVVNKPPKVVTFTAPSFDPSKAKKGEVSITASVAGKNVALTMPAGWTADAPASDGMITLHHPAVAGTISVSLASILDSDPPQSAILKASALTLNQFSKVQKRNETSSKFSTAGAATSTIWRMGSGANGAITTCEAVGNIDELYWLMRYNLVGAATPAEMKAVNELIDAMSVDPMP